MTVWLSVLIWLPDSREEKKSEEKTASEKRERRGEERRKPAKKSGSAGIFDRLPKSKKASRNTGKNGQKREAENVLKS